MRKYLSLAVVALSSGGALVAAAGAASAATANDNWRAAPWLSSSPQAVHAAPWAHHATAGDDAICGAQKALYHVGQIVVKLEQKGCLGDWTSTPSVPGPPPVMGPPPTGDPCPVICVPTHPTPPPPPPVKHPCPPPPPPVPCPPPVVKPPCPPTPPPPPPVPCPPPTPKPCPPHGEHKWAADQAADQAAPAATQTAAPAAGNAVAGLPIVGSALGGLL